MHLVHSVEEAQGEAALDPYKDGSVGHLGDASEIDREIHR